MEVTFFWFWEHFAFHTFVHSRVQQQKRLQQNETKQRGLIEKHTAENGIEKVVQHL